MNIEKIWHWVNTSKTLYERSYISCSKETERYKIWFPKAGEGVSTIAHPV